jgi:hypothetical protein
VLYILEGHEQHGYDVYFGLEGYEQYGYVIIFWKGINCDVNVCSNLFITYATIWLCYYFLEGHQLFDVYCCSLTCVSFGEAI